MVVVAKSQLKKIISMKFKLNHPNDRDIKWCSLGENIPLRSDCQADGKTASLHACINMANWKIEWKMPNVFFLLPQMLIELLSILCNIWQCQRSWCAKFLFFPNKFRFNLHFTRIITITTCSTTFVRCFGRRQYPNGERERKESSFSFPCLSFSHLLLFWI